MQGIYMNADLDEQFEINVFELISPPNLISDIRSKK